MNRIRVLLGLILFGALYLGMVIGRPNLLHAQSDPWATAPFGIGLAVTVTSCGAQSLTPGTYSQVTIGLGGKGC